MARVVLAHYPHHIVQRGQLTGTDRFAQEVADILGRRIERRGHGRPAKSKMDQKWATGEK